MTASRAKGTRAESAVVEFMKANGWPHAERHAQHGSRDIGDVNVGPAVVVEVKASSRMSLAEWMAELGEEMDNADTDMGVCVVKRRGTTDVGKYYAVSTFDVWCRMAKDAGL